MARTGIRHFELAGAHDNYIGCIGIMLIFGVCWSAVTLVCDGVIGWGIIQQLRAVGYSTTQGRIAQSEVAEEPGDGGPRYHVELKYHYRVADRPCEGTRYRYGLRLFSTRQAAQRIVAEHPVDKQVVVYYRANDPQDAILRAGIGGADLFDAMVLVPFNLVMLATWIGVRRGLVATAAQPVAGGARVLEDGICVRVRQSSVPPLTVAAIAAGAVSFVGVCIVAAGFGADPPMPVMLVAWAVILATGTCAYVYWQWKLQQRDRDLVIDSVCQVVTLSRTLLGHQADVVVPIRQFTSVEVEQVEKTDSDGTRYCRYVPVLTFTDWTGATRREKTVEWLSRAHAERLVAWLRERLHIEPPNEPLQ